MKIIVEKITTVDDMREACCFTLNDQPERTTMTLEKIYQCLHSPARTQWFKVKMYGIPTSVSIHLARHNGGGTLHYVKTNRPDRGSVIKADRDTPVNHMIWCNAEMLINIAHARMCYKSEAPTVKVMAAVAEATQQVDPDLFELLVPKCVYLQRCPELKSCGFFKEVSAGVEATKLDDEG
jgi:hypothetical protein